MKKLLTLVAAAFLTASALCCMSNAQIPSPENETEVTNERASGERGLHVEISIDINGGNGEVIATAKNNFTLFPAVVKVYVELYSSATRTTDYREMTLEALSYKPDLDMGKTVEASKGTGGEQKYWLARVTYQLDDTAWQELNTDCVLFDANGNVVS